MEAKKAVDSASLVAMGKNIATSLRAFVQVLQSHFEGNPDKCFPLKFEDGLLENLEKADHGATAIALDFNEMTEIADGTDMEVQTHLNADLKLLMQFIEPCAQRDLGLMKDWVAMQWTGSCLTCGGIEEGSSLNTVVELRDRISMLARAFKIHGGFPRHPVYFFSFLLQEAMVFSVRLDEMTAEHKGDARAILLKGSTEFIQRMATVHLDRDAAGGENYPDLFEEFYGSH